MRPSIDLLTRVTGEVEALSDWIRYRTRRRRTGDRYYIEPYRGHGTAEMIHISGRVFEGSPPGPAREGDGRLRNLWRTMQRFGADEVPAACVKVTADGLSATVIADDSGFFEIALPVPRSVEVGATSWRQAEIELIDPRPPGQPVIARGEALVPPASAAFGIISDLDDTVVRADATNLLRMFRLVLLTNGRTRPPFPGVAAFYRALHRGSAGPETNPLFYVSGSPWNLYAVFSEVFEVHEIPRGPLFLKNFGIANELRLSPRHDEHKRGAIDHIFSSHPELPFILIGDTGHRDPEIYAEVVRRYPGRVRAIYIRDVGSDAREAEVERIADQVRQNGSEMVRVRDTLAAAEHAAQRGWVQASEVDEVRLAQARDLTAPGPLEGLFRRGR